MTNSQQPVVVRLNRLTEITFHGHCLANVVALNHDDSVRRRFCAYKTDAGYVGERVDNPGTIDVRYFGIECVDVLALYDFFGNEPLANYLYGAAGLSVPGLQAEGVQENA